MADLPDTGTTMTLGDGAYLYVTESDDGTVVDLVYTDDTGVYMRTNGQWTVLPAEGDDPIDGKIVSDVSPDYVEQYDTSRASDAPISSTDAKSYSTNAA